MTDRISQELEYGLKFLLDHNGSISLSYWDWGSDSNKKDGLLKMHVVSDMGEEVGNQILIPRPHLECAINPLLQYFCFTFKNMQRSLYISPDIESGIRDE